jgi:sugar phosphate isomerase/epimerase
MKSSRGSDHAGEIMGCCGSMISPSTDPIGIEIVETMAEIGFDYTELSLSDIAALPEGAFADLARRVERSRIQCEACNNFFPRTIRLTGAEAHLHVALDYARFFEAMRSIQYSGRCSIEAYTHDFPTDARRAIRILRC